MMYKISNRESLTDALIRKIKHAAKRDSTVISKFKEYGVPISYIEKINICFCNMNVSAKTKNKNIYLNNALITKSNFSGIMSYVVHELTHVLQQLTGKTYGIQKADYLEKDTEVEAFEAQIEFKENREGPRSANKYVDDLLDYHNYTGAKRVEKKKELLGDK